MTALLVSKRGTITIPSNLRRKLGLDQIKNPMILVEERAGGLFLQTATPIPLRNFTKSQMEKWIEEDEKGMEKFVKAEY